MVHRRRDIEAGKINDGSVIFGITTDVHTGPNGNLFVMSLSNGTLYEISRR